jgi:hypothetical protein
VERWAWDTIGAAAGVLFVALFLIGFGFEVKDFPEAGLASAEQIRGFVEHNRFRIGVSTAAYALAWTSFVWFVACMRAVLSRNEDRSGLSSVAFGSGLLTAGLFLAGTALQSEVIFSDWATGDEVTTLSQWALYDASGGLFGITPFPRALFIGAAAVAVIREGGLPRWLGWAGVLAAFANLVGGFDYLAASGRSLTGHPLIDLFAFLVWVLLASGSLFLRPGRTAT